MSTQVQSLRELKAAQAAAVSAARSKVAAATAAAKQARAAAKVAPASDRAAAKAAVIRAEMTARAARKAARDTAAMGRVAVSGAARAVKKATRKGATRTDKARASRALAALGEKAAKKLPPPSWGAAGVSSHEGRHGDPYLYAKILEWMPAPGTTIMGDRFEVVVDSLALRWAGWAVHLDENDDIVVLGMIPFALTMGEAVKNARALAGLEAQSGGAGRRSGWAVVGVVSGEER